jgi:hypothetical protein
LLFFPDNDILINTFVRKMSIKENKVKQFGKFAAFFVLFALIGASGAFALDIRDSPPTVTGTEPLATNVNTAIGTAWTQVITELDRQVGGIDAKPEDLIKGFADASVFASQGATQRGYGEPKLFAFTIGPMVGVKIGTGLGEIASVIDTIADDLQKDGDLNLGLNIQAISGQFTLNTSRFLLKGLDLGVRFGVMKLDDSLLPGFSFNTLSFGVVGNYQILKEKTLVPVLVKWRGVSLGTGFIFQNTKLSYGMDLDPISENLGGSYGSVKFDPKLVFDMDTTTFTIPLEANTAIQLFSFLNIHLGVGADLAFGKNDMKLGLEGDVTLEGLPGGITQNQAGSLGVSGGGDMAPSFFNFKLMTGLGFKFGPAVLDIPVTLYLGDGTGANVGVTIGVIW